MLLARMADSVTADDLPTGLPAYAGYIDGDYPSFPGIVRRFGGIAHCVSITIDGGNARILDVEQGNPYTPDALDRAVDWLCTSVGQRPDSARSIRDDQQLPWRPGIYLPALHLSALEDELAKHPRELARDKYVIWVASWGWPASTMPYNVDAVQYRGSIPGAHYDLSVLGPRFLRTT